MTCPSPEIAAAMAEGRLSDADRDAFLDHAAGCDDCRPTRLSPASLAFGNAVPACVWTRKPMRPLRICALAVTVAAVAACRSAATSDVSAQPDLTQTTAAASTAPANASPTPQSTPDVRPLQGLLPAGFRGTEAHTFPVGQDMLARLAAAIGIRRRSLEAAYASDHGPAFVQLYALRAAGHDPHELLAVLPAAAYPSAPAGSVTVEPGQLADRSVTVISKPSQAGTIGSFYALIDGGTLIVAQALAEPVAQAAFDELPSP
jgi:hypothetical protein